MRGRSSDRVNADAGTDRTPASPTSIRPCAASVTAPCRPGAPTSSPAVCYAGALRFHMLFAPPPVYNDPYGEFTTAFKPLKEPGFFPVHSGRIPSEGPSQQARARVVIYGTDWGWIKYADACREAVAAGRECDCQRSLRPASSGPRPNRTEPKLFDALQCAGVDLATVALTNAVLALGPEQIGQSAAVRVMALRSAMPYCVGRLAARPAPPQGGPAAIRVLTIRGRDDRQDKEETA